MATVMFLILFIVVLVASLLGLFAIFSVYVGYVHWKYSHIPAPKRESFFLGHVPLIARELERGKIMDEVLDELHRIHGSVVLIWLYHKPLVFLSDPELARKCLVTLNLPKNPFSYTSLGFPFGQRMAGNGLVTQIDHGVWQKRRTVLNPAFHRRHLMNFMSAFNNSCDLFLNKLDEIADGKTIVDMAQEFSRVTLDVIGKVAFNVDVNVLEDANSPFPRAIATCLEGVQSSFRTPFWRINVPQFPFQKSVSQATRFVRDYAKKVIQERQEAILRGDDTPLDILAHILSLAEAEPSLTLEDMVDEFVTFYFADVTRCHLVAHLMLENFLVMIIVKETLCGTYTRFGYWANHYVPNEKESYHLYKQPKNKRVMSLLFTGQETTSNQLSFTLYEILKNSDIKNRLVQEIEAVLGSRQFVEYKDLGNLQYLGQTLKEGLRLHPPAEATSRITTRDDYFAGHLLPKGTSVFICWFILHRLPDLWPEPRKFDPERFSPEAKSPGHGQSAPYFPFSLGPRTCIGQTFAQFEARVLMARLLQEFELSLLPGQNELRHEERLTLRPKGGVLCTIKRRGTVS